MKKIIFSILLITISAAVFAQQKRIVPPTPYEQMNKHYGISLFKGVHGVYFDLENDPNALTAISYINILNWLEGRVAGLQVYEFRGVPVAFIRNNPAAIFVDEVRMDASVLNFLPVADIALIKVMNMPLGIVNAPGGVIAIYTKRGEAEEEEEI
jgi:hypothetical protein